MVATSLTQRRWVYPAADERLAQALAQRFALPEMVARIMAVRGISLDAAADFLQPTLRNLLPDPMQFKDMAVGVARMVQALRNKEKIAVFGDYDVDGATSSALILQFCRGLTANITSYIPDRIAEGYGPNSPAIQKLAAQGITVLITVDCGTTAFEPLEVARGAGMAVIVLDHHVAEPRLPAVTAMVNPNRLDETTPHRHLAAVGVTFLFLVALNTALRQHGFYQHQPEPDLKAMLDIVALGTVADVVSLTGINRAFVRQGLKVLATTRNIGLQALLKSSRATPPFDAYTAGFLLGPRINAGGRVGKADLGTRLLTTANPQEASQLAATLEQLNEERRAIEALAVEEALQQVFPENAAAVLVDSENWHVGVIGLVASRLKDRFNRPALVTAFTDGIGKGSCRSVKGVNIGSLIIAARQEGLLLNGGGHAMAAGFTVAHSNYSAFCAFIEQRLARQLAETPLEPSLTCDGILAIASATTHLAQSLESLAPFGAGNPEPRFTILDARLLQTAIMAEKHLRLVLGDDHGNSLRCVWWRSLPGAAAEQVLALPRHSRLHVAGTLRINRYAMRDEVQLVVEDVALG